MFNFAMCSTQRTFSVWIRPVPGLYQTVYSLIRIITTYPCQIILSPALYQTVSTVLILVVYYLYQNCILSIYSYDLFQMCMYQTNNIIIIILRFKLLMIIISFVIAIEK